MCPPGHASSRDPFTGRHTGRPLQIPLQHPLTPQKRTGTEPRPYRSIVVPSSGLMWASAPTKGVESHIGNPGQRRRAERLRRGWEEGVGIVAEIIPKVSGNLGQSLSRGLWPRQLPLHKGALACGAGGAGGHIGPPLRGHRSAQQPQAGRDRARPLREHRECRSAGRCTEGMASADQISVRNLGRRS